MPTSLFASKNTTLALALAALLGTTACTLPGSMPERRGSEVTVLTNAGLSELNPSDVAVAPVVVLAENVTVPELGLRQALQRALVRRRYSPLSLDFVDSRVVNASYQAGSLGEQAICELVVHSWDDRFWGTSQAVDVDVELRMIDPTAPSTSPPLWSARMTGRADVSGMRLYTPEPALQQAVLDEIALELMARMPARDTSPGMR